MILLPLILTPVGITILLLVMSWTERALDRGPRQERREPTPTLTAVTTAARTPVDRAGLTEPLIAQ